MPRFDCESCGACCTNPDANRAAGERFYVEVVDTKLLRNPDRLRRLTVLDANGVPHMKLDGHSGRCIALRGKLGVRVSCAIYALRPKGCRMVEPGDANCERSRRERGIRLE